MNNKTASMIEMETAFSVSDMPQFSMEVNQALLKEDDDLLRQIFSQVFRHHQPELANKVDVIFSLAQVGAGNPAEEHAPWFRSLGGGFGLRGVLYIK